MKVVWGLVRGVDSYQAQDESLLGLCWPSVYDADPTLNQYSFNVYDADLTLKQH